MNQNLENLRLALASHALVQIATVFGSFGSPREKSQSDVDIVTKHLDEFRQFAGLIDREA